MAKSLRITYIRRILLTKTLQPKLWSPLVWATLSTCLFASMNVFARLASREAHWSVVAFARAAFGAGVALFVSRLRRSEVHLRGTSAMWKRSLFGTSAMICTFYVLGSSVLPLGDASTLFALSPVWVALLSPYLLKEDSNRRVNVAILFSTLGILLVVRPSFLFGSLSHLPRAATVPAIVALVTAFLSAFAMMTLRIATRDETPESIAVHFSLTATVITALVALSHVKVFSAGTYLSMAGAGFSAGFAQLLMTKAYSMAPAARIGAVGNLTTVFTILFGTLVFREIPTLLSVAGIALVLFATSLLSSGPKPSAA